jgi:acyl-CoA synthetase (AMP-forming)/AMP-acid ligase II
MLSDGSVRRSAAKEGTVMSALARLSAEALARDPQRAAIEFEDRWFTWGEFRQLAERMQAAIADSGAAPNAPVAFVPRNRPPSAAALLGLVAQARTIRMIYAFQSGAGIARDLQRLAPAVMVAGAEVFTDEVRAALSAHGIAAVVLDAAMDAAPLTGFERSTAEVAAPANPQIEVLTSGTTGPPKQFAIGYDVFEGLARGATAQVLGGAPGAQAPAEATGADAPLFLCKPIGNIAGLYSTLPTLLQGQLAVLVDRFSLDGWRAYVRRYRPERTGMPATGVQGILDAEVPREELACLRSLSTGASPLDITIQRRFEETYGVPILLSYGATEFAGPVAAMTPALVEAWGAGKRGSVGRALGEAQLRVVDEAGHPLPPGAEGVLEVIAPRVGTDWIHTSDVAVIDEDGFLFIRGRNDGAIMRGGFKLLPETIERALMLHEAVSAAGVVGVPDRRLGEVPAAAVQLKPGAHRPSPADLEAHLRQHVLKTHLPAHWRIVDALPLTATEKVDRPALRELFETPTG